MSAVADPLVRRALRAPTRLYANGWGWALGRRFLQLTHRGRRSGLLRHTVLEVLSYDPAAREAVVVAGLGASSDWLRNLRHNGFALVTTGGHSFAAVHRMLSDDEAVATLRAYERAHPVARPLIRPVLSRLVGWRYDGSDDARRRLVREMPMVALRATWPQGHHPS